MKQPPFIEQQAMTVWVTDAELIRRSGVPEKVMRANLRALDANPLSGFPRKDPLWAGRRHWPSVQKFWEDRANRAPAAHPAGTMSYPERIRMARKLGARI